MLQFEPQGSGPRRRAFTVVELLVVIAIIAVLAALLFPVFARAKRSSQISASLSQLSQIGRGIQMYAVDYDDVIPHASGNNCYRIAMNRNGGCTTADAATLRATRPLNAVLQPVKVPWDTFRSPVDEMGKSIHYQMDHKPTWFEETKTALYPGSSFEYTSLGLHRTSLAGLPNPSKVPIVTSLFTLGEEKTPLYQVHFADGHVKAVPDSQLLWSNQ